MPLTQHHKGMKIAANVAFFVGEGLSEAETLPDKAVPYPYTIFPNARLFSEGRRVCKPSLPH